MKRKPSGWNVLLIVCGLLGSSALAAGPGQTQSFASSDSVPEGLSASDWTSIRAAYQAHRHQAVPVEGGYRARNPEQQWRTEFDGRGFMTQPDAGGWQWGLELKSYGFPGKKREVRSEAPMNASGNRVTYIRDRALSEWFVNDPRGLEHGFTLDRPPGQPNEAGAELEFDLAVRGNLRPEIAHAGRALCFRDGEGGTKLTYAELRAWDAGGRELAARFVPHPDGVRLKVETAGARYPITIDPLAQQAYLKASNTEANDLFGISVAISGETVVVAARGEDSNATGVNGDQTDNSAPESGAAYVFVRDGATWSQQAYLKASNTEALDLFGSSVAISGETIVVAASGEDSNATGSNGDQSNNSAPFSGAAYVFVRDGASWSQQAYLKASNTEAGDSFGTSVAISGETVVVGAEEEDSSASGINGDENDNSAPDSGAAYVFLRDGATWSQQAYLKASNPGAGVDQELGDVFGFSVAISGETVVVGAKFESSNATGINGDQTNDSARDSGAAYVFVRDGATWSQQAYVKASNTEADDVFGFSVAISGDTLVVGAQLEGSSATGVNGDQTDNSALFSGAAYVFLRDGATWSQQAYLKASNTEFGDAFGTSVAISGETVVVGAFVESSDATGVNGDQTDNSATLSGAAYVFVRDGATWSQQAYLKASNTETNDEFGTSVAISGETVVVGADGESSSASGINGDQTDNSATDSGAAYVFVGLPTTLGNISTRLRVETGDNVLIGGFIIAGTESKKVLLRAIGPSLPLGGVLANPILELHDGAGLLLASNDNWMDSPNKQEIIDSMLPPPKDLESAILTPLDPGLYTAIVRGVNNTTGIALVEAYDADPVADSVLANISARGLVQTGDNVMIGGFIVAGHTPQEVLVRAIGPSLPLAGELADPELELHDSDGAILATNDNWRSDQEADIMATNLAPSDDAESAILVTLSPNAYTAIVQGKNDTTGIALVEVYRLGE